MYSVVDVGSVMLLSLGIAITTSKITQARCKKKGRSFDLSTQLLIEQRNARRYVNKAQKVSALAKIELDIEWHLNDIEVQVANNSPATKH